MTTNPNSREAAYADLVTGLIDARVDVASDRFDSELEAAESSGRLDPATARLLRWWQRESVRAVSEHARATIPGTLVALERAAAESRDAVNRADAAWTTARGVSARSTYAPTPPAAPIVEPEPAAWAEPAYPEPAAPPIAPIAYDPYIPPAPAGYAPAFEPLGYPVEAVPAAPGEPIQPVEPVAPFASVVPTAPAPLTTETAYESAPDEVPAIVDLTSETETDSTPPVGRRRTLLAGLTVLPRSD